MASIDTLVEDIYAVLGGNKPPSDIVDNITSNAEFAKRVLQHIHADLVPDDRTDRDPDEFYVTQVSNPCWRKAWLDKFKHDAVRERALSGATKFKFLYGDLIEEAFLYLAQAAGHEVTDTQRRFSIPLPGKKYKLAGRIDAVVDGWLVDVKSSDPFTFDRMVKGTYDDKFGYETQLHLYEHMSPDKYKGVANIFVNKVNGKIHVHKWTNPVYGFIENALEEFADVVDEAHPPMIPYDIEDDGSLCTACSYCPLKFHCYKGLRVFAYSTGPKFVAESRTKIKVTEITDAYKKQADVR
jgi:hypothetical protein